jgi:hypothetical protein
MGILPLQFEEGQNFQVLGISGFEAFDIEGLTDNLKPRKKITVTAISQDGSKKNFTVVCRIDTPNEVDYYKHGGILQYVLRSLLKPDQTIIGQQKKPVIEGKTQKYRILFNGDIEQGQELPAVKERLTQLFKTSPEQIDKLFTGKSVTINNNLDYTAAQEYIAELKNAGALCYFEPMKVIHSPQISGLNKTTQTLKGAKAGSPAQSSLSSSKSKGSSKIETPLDLDSPLHTIGRILTAGGMIFLLFLYVFLILFLASSTFDHISDNTSLLRGESFIIGIPVYFILLFLGILLVVSMLKPLIARPISKHFAVPLFRTLSIHRRKNTIDHRNRLFHRHFCWIPTRNDRNARG